MRSFGNSIAEAFDKVMSKTQSTQTTDNDTSDSASAKTILPRNSPPTHRVPQNSISHKIMVKCPRCNTDILWELLGTHLLKCPIKGRYPIVQAQKPRVVVKKPEAPHKSKQVPQKPVYSFDKMLKERPEVLAEVATELSNILERGDITYERAFRLMPKRSKGMLVYASEHGLWSFSLLSQEARRILLLQQQKKEEEKIRQLELQSQQKTVFVARITKPSMQKPQHGGVHDIGDDSLKAFVGKANRLCRGCGSTTVIPGEDKCYSCQSE